MPSIYDLRKGSEQRTLEWDAEKAQAGDETEQQKLEEARARFEKHRKDGGEVLVTPGAGGPPKRTTEFDPEADMIFAPRVAGG
jgi:hypothetical protein